MESSILTVAIPTYNRREKLLRTLSSLEKQTDDKFKILIIDNCSNYKIEEIFENFSEEFTSRIECISNKCNIGVCVNIALGYLYCDTEWCWGISDDDILPNNAIEIINKNILSHRNAGFLEFPLMNYSSYIKEEKKFTNIAAYINFFSDLARRGYSAQGTMIYCGARVFNISKNSNELFNAFEYSYTGIAHTIIALTALKEGRMGIVIPESPIVYDNSSGIHWDAKKICRGLATMEYVPFDLSKKEIIKLMKLIMPDFHFVFESIIYDEKYERTEYLFEIYNLIYKQLLDIKHKIVYGIVCALCKHTYTYSLIKKAYKFKTKRR